MLPSYHVRRQRDSIKGSSIPKSKLQHKKLPSTQHVDLNAHLVNDSHNMWYSWSCRPNQLRALKSFHTHQKTLTQKGFKTRISRQNLLLALQKLYKAAWKQETFGQINYYLKHHSTPGKVSRSKTENYAVLNGKLVGLVSLRKIVAEKKTQLINIKLRWEGEKQNLLTVCLLLCSGSCCQKTARFWEKQFWLVFGEKQPKISLTSVQQLPNDCSINARPLHKNCSKIFADCTKMLFCSEDGLGEDVVCACKHWS